MSGRSVRFPRIKERANASNDGARYVKRWEATRSCRGGDGFSEFSNDGLLPARETYETPGPQNRKLDLGIYGTCASTRKRLDEAASSVNSKVWLCILRVTMAGQSIVGSLSCSRVAFYPRCGSRQHWRLAFAKFWPAAHGAVASSSGLVRSSASCAH